MDVFELKVVTPDGIFFDGSARKLLLRTVLGDTCILPNHANLVSTLDVGRVRITTDEGESSAACSGGFVQVADGVVRLVANTFEYAESIDVARAESAKERAERRIAAKSSEQDVLLAEMKLKRALNRIRVASGK